MTAPQEDFSAKILCAYEKLLYLCAEKFNNMEGKSSLCKVLRSLIELDLSLERELLMDYIMGRPTQAIAHRGLDNTENYGCGDDKDEEHWAMVLDKAIEEGYLKMKAAGGIAPMAKGKKFLAKPTSFELNDEEDEEEGLNKEDLDGLVANVLSDDDTLKVSHQAKLKSATSQRKLILIQAIDRHIDLDDFASNHGIDFEELLNDIEALMQSGMKIDIRYFCEEVLGNDAIDELKEYFNGAANDSLSLAFDEYGDVYSREELHLGRIIWRSEK